jgi:integrase
VKGSITQRSSGSYSIILDLGKDPATGKRQQKWHTFKGTKRQAQDECARLIASMKGGTYLEPSKTTVAEYLDHWLKDVRSRVSPKTHERYAEICKKNIGPVVGSVPLTKLKPAQISAAYAEALVSGRLDGTGGLSPRTVHHMHRILKQALKQAVRWELIIRNPAEAVNPPKVEKTTMTTYDLPQTGQLIAAMREKRLFVPVLLAALLGMRRGEIAALRWKSVDLDKGQLAVIESVEQMNGVVRLKPPKNGRSRTLALGETIISELRTHRLVQAQELLKNGVRQSGDQFVCSHPDGSLMQPTWITHEWGDLIRKTDLPPYRFHDLRHAHATHLLGSGIHPKVTSERLGHSSIGITLDLYSHVMPGMQEDAAAQVDAALQAAISKRPK